MSNSEPFNHSRDIFMQEPGTPQNPSRVSFWSNHVRLLVTSSTSYCKIVPITTPGSTQVNFSLSAFDSNNSLLSTIHGDFPCPNNCQPPSPDLAPLIKFFDVEHINKILNSYPFDSLFDVSLSIRDVLTSTSHNPNSYSICSNSYNPSSPTSGGGPRRGLGDEIFISL